MSFRAPYKFRIMTAIGEDVFELKRFHRQIHPDDEAFWMEGRESRTWVERPLLDSETDTDRPCPADPSRSGARKLAIKINQHEHTTLENMGLVKEYKL